MKNNKGYTLVEVIIVIAIMAILSAVSFVTVGIIRKAKRSAAVNTFNNQISSCLVKTKAISDAGSTSPVCMVIQKRAKNYVILLGYYDGTDVKDMLSNQTIDSDDDLQCESVLPNEVIIKQNGNEISDKAVICFNKSDGSVKDGSGNYQFIINKGGTEEVYATIYLDKTTGNHYIK